MYQPPGLDEDNWCRILVFNQFGSTPSDFRISITNFVKDLCNTNIHLSNSGTSSNQVLHHLKYAQVKMQDSRQPFMQYMTFNSKMKPKPSL